MIDQHRCKQKNHIVHRNWRYRRHCYL